MLTVTYNKLCCQIIYIKLSNYLTYAVMGCRIVTEEERLRERIKNKIKKEY